MLIRVLDAPDAETYRQIRLQSLLDSPESFLTTYDIEKDKSIRTVADNLVPSASRFTLGAFDDNHLIGIITLVRETRDKTAHKANVYALFVTSEWRGQGIGKALMLELISRARLMKGLEQINLAVVSNNAPAKRLYSSLGFTVYGTETNAMKSDGKYWDEDFMVLRL